MKTIAITGGNRGIGFLVAKSLIGNNNISNDIRVVLCARSLSKANEAASQLLDLCYTGGSNDANTKSPSTSLANRIVPMELDLTNEQSVMSFWNRLPSDALPLDCLVNNAGVYESGWTLSTFVNAVTVNFFSPTQLAEAAILDPTKLRDGGGLVYVSSGGGSYNELSTQQVESIETAVQHQDLNTIRELANPKNFDMLQEPSGGWGYPCYTWSKALGNAFHRILAWTSKMKGRKIGVAVVCPGWCRTDMGGQAAPRSAEEGATSVLNAIELALKDDASSGDATFTRDGKVIPW